MALEWHPIFLADTSTGVDDTSGAIPGISMDKVFTVPNDRIWHIQSILCTAVSSATVGNRVLAFQVQRGSSDTDPIVDVRSAVAQAASLTRYYQFSPNLLQASAFADTDWLTVTIPDLVLPAGSIIRVFDEAAIGDTAAPDDLSVELLVDQAGHKSS